MAPESAASEARKRSGGTVKGTATATSSTAKPPKKRKVTSEDAAAEETKKTQIRYDPSEPMGKDELAAWRREARRVRNRESAAASRQRIRNRISELEDEVGQWKSKYAEAVQRLEALEAAMATRPEALAAAAAAHGGGK
ncbi:MAG: hypothetical protein SGARI_004884 [Bacillariaceae sp.]